MALSPTLSILSSQLDLLTPAHRNLLIQTTSKLRHAKLYRAPIAIQRQLTSKCESVRQAIAKLYPLVDFTHPILKQDLQQRGDGWWQAKKD